MLDRSRLFLLTGSSTSRHQNVYTGISLTDERQDLGDDEVWNAWIISNPPVRADFVKHQVTCAHLSTSDGSMWELDGIVSKASDRKPDPAQPRQNQVSLLKCVPPVDLALPVFIGDDPSIKPCRDTVLITLNVQKLIQFPDLKTNFDFLESHFGLKNSAVADQLRQQQSVSPEAGTTLPVEIAQSTDGKKSARCALLLHQSLGERRFLCKLYRSDSSVHLRSGDILRRRACLPAEHKTFISEFEIGTLEKIIETNELAAEAPNEGIVNQPRYGGIFAIACVACKREFTAADFTPEQMQVIDLWGWYYPFEKERSLLQRVVNLRKRHPGLQGEAHAKLHTPLRDLNQTFGEMPDPRSDSSKNQFKDATADDPELREFLSTSSCNYEGRLEWIGEKAEKQAQKLNGRIVICPACGDGPVIIRNWDLD